MTRAFLYLVLGALAAIAVLAPRPAAAQAVQNVDLIATVPLAGNALGVATDGLYSYVAAGSTGLRIVQRGNPTAEVGSVSLPGVAADVAVEGGYAYLAVGAEGVQVVDVRDRARPVRVGSFDTAGPAAKLALYRDFTGRLYAYVATTTGNRLQVVDVTDPARPVAGGGDYYGIAPIGAIAQESSVQGGGTYVGEGSTLRLMHLSGGAPYQNASVTLLAPIVDLAVATGVVYAATGNGGLRIVGSNGSAWAELGSFATSAPITGVAIESDVAYVAAGSAGVRVLDVSDPTKPREIGYYDTTGSANDVTVLAHDVHVADGPGGLAIVRYAGFPTSPVPQAYLPLLLQNAGWAPVPGRFVGSLSVQAAGTLPPGGAGYTLRFLRPDGSIAFETLQRALSASAADLLYVPALVGLTNGRYMVVALSTEPLVLKANLASSGPNGTAALVATSASAVATSVFVPAVYQGYAGYSSAIALQNASGTAASATVTFRDQTGSVVGSTQIAVPANGAADLVPAVPAGFVGSAAIAAEQPVAAAAVTWGAGGELIGTAGVTDGASRIDLPVIYKSYSADHWVSAILVQNLDPQPACVRLTFLDAAPSGPAPRTIEDTIPGSASRQYWQGAVPTSLPEGFLGSSVVESLDGQRLAAVVNTRNAAGHLDGYAGTPSETRRLAELRFPDVYNDYSDLHWTSSIVLKPVPESAFVTYTIRFYPHGSADPVLTLYSDYTAGGQPRLYYLPNVRFGAETLPRGFHGSAVVTFESGGRMVGVANNLAAGASGGDWLLSYRGASAS
jgi:hypothetical protein